MTDLQGKVPLFLVASLTPPTADRGWGSIVKISTMDAGFSLLDGLPTPTEDERAE